MVSVTIKWIYVLSPREVLLLLADNEEDEISIARYDRSALYIEELNY